MQLFWDKYGTEVEEAEHRGVKQLVQKVNGSCAAGLAWITGECSVHSGTFVVISGRGEQGTLILHMPCK